MACTIVTNNSKKAKEQHGLINGHRLIWGVNLLRTISSFRLSKYGLSVIVSQDFWYEKHEPKYTYGGITLVLWYKDKKNLVMFVDVKLMKNNRALSTAPGINLKRTISSVRLLNYVLTFIVSQYFWYAERESTLSTSDMPNVSQNIRAEVFLLSCGIKTRKTWSCL